MRPAYLFLDGWAGIHRQGILVIGETPQRYRIQAIAETRLAGRRRYLRAGGTALVPKSSVRLLDGEME